MCSYDGYEPKDNEFLKGIKGYAAYTEILEEYLSNREKEVVDMMMTLRKVAGKYKLEENDAQAWVQRYWKTEGGKQLFSCQEENPGRN